jgi:uncharacterized protein involved in exopolysaccharide biosynthesis
MVKLISLRVLESYFRHRWLNLLPLIIMSAIAVASVLLAKPKYIASGVVYVEKESLLSTLVSIKESTFSWDTPANETSTEISELLQTNAFLRAVIEMTDLEAKMDGGDAVVADTIDYVREAVWTEASGNNQVMIAASDEDPQLAYQMVNSVIENYIQWKINADRAESLAAQKFFENLIVQYENDLEIATQELENYLAAHPMPVRGDRSEVEQLELERLQSALDLARSQYASAIEKNDNIKLTLSQAESGVRQTYLLIDAPKVPEEPTTSLKDTAVRGAIFMAVGVILVGVGIVGNILLDRSLRFPVDVHFGLDLPVLALVPDVTEQRSKKRIKKKAHSAKDNQTNNKIPITPQEVGQPSTTSADSTEPDLSLSEIEDKVGEGEKALV